MSEPAYEFVSMGAIRSTKERERFDDGVVYFAKARVNGELYGCLLAFTPELIADTSAFPDVSQHMAKETIIKCYKRDHPTLDTAPDLVI